MKKLIFLILILSLVLPNVATSANMRISEFQITNTPDQKEFWPDIDGNIVVWTWGYGNSVDQYIAGYNLETQKYLNINQSYGYKQSPRVSGDWVVWVDRGVGGYSPPSGIYASNIKTGEVRTIFTGVCGCLTYADIDGKYVVWDEESPSEYYQGIFLYDLSTQETTLINNDPGLQWAPVTDSQWVVWNHMDECPQCNDVTLRAYNINTKETINLPCGTNDYNPDISNNILVWQRGFFDIYGMNLSTQEVTTITTSSDYSLSYPRIDGSSVVWGSSNGSIYHYDISTREIITVTVGKSDALPSISSNVMVWVRSGDIYGARLYETIFLPLVKHDLSNPPSQVFDVEN